MTICGGGDVGGIWGSEAAADSATAAAAVNSSKRPWWSSEKSSRSCCSFSRMRCSALFRRFSSTIRDASLSSSENLTRDMNGLTIWWGEVDEVTPPVVLFVVEEEEVDGLINLLGRSWRGRALEAPRLYQGIFGGGGSRSPP